MDCSTTGALLSTPISTDHIHQYITDNVDFRVQYLTLGKVQIPAPLCYLPFLFGIRNFLTKNNIAPAGTNR